MPSLNKGTACGMTTYFVSGSNGSDGNPGTQGAPFLTIQHGISVMDTGDVLYIRGGSYAGPLDSNSLTFPTGTSWSNAPLISGFQNETVTISSGTNEIINIASPSLQYLIFSNLVLNGSNGYGFSIQSGANHIRVQDSEIRNTSLSGVIVGSPTTRWNELLRLRIDTCGGDHFDHGIYLQSPDNLIEGCDLSACSGCLLHLYHSDGLNGNRPDRTIARNNRLHDHFGTLGPIIIASGNDMQIYNNLIYNSTGIAIHLIGQASGTLIYNNTIYANNSIGVYTGGAANGTYVYNNIFYANGGAPIDGPGLNTFTSTNWTDANGDPRFTNPGALDFTLQTSSGCIDTGTSLPGIVDADFDGNPRPVNGVWDIGAYESGSGGGGPHIPTTYYVSTSGNNTNVGNDINFPFRTIEKGVSTLQAGDTLLIRTGTYPESINASAFTVRSGTGWDLPITIAAYENETVTLTGASAVLIHLTDNVANAHYLTFQRLRLDVSGWSGGSGVIVGQGSGHILLEQLEIWGASGTGAGIYSNTTSHNIVVYRCTVRDNPTAYGIWLSGNNNIVDQCTIQTCFVGLQFWDYSGIDVSDNVARRNRFISNGVADGNWYAAAVWVGKGVNNSFQNNLFYGNNVGLIVSDGAHYASVFNNTIYGSTLHGMHVVESGIGGCEMPIGVEITNNIVYNNGTNYLDAGTPGGVTLLTNLIGTNPLFANAAGNDFHLTTLSPARDTGTTLSLIFTQDFAGLTRFGAWEIGAYDMPGVAQPPPTIVRWGIPTPTALRKQATAQPTPAIVRAVTPTGGVRTAASTTRFAQPTAARSLVTILAPTLRGNTYYVASTGSNGNNGTIGAPFATIEYGVERLLAGDTLFIREGTWADTITPITMTLASGVSWERPIRIAGYPGEVVTLQRIELTDGTANVQYVSFENLILDAQGSGNHAVYIGSGSHHIQVLACELANGNGITNVGTGLNAHATASHNIIQQTYVHDFTTGIVLASPSNIVTDTTVAGCFGDGMLLLAAGTPTADSNTVTANVVYGCGRGVGSFYAIVAGSGDDNLVANNVLHDNTGGGVCVVGGNPQRTLVYHNTITGNTGIGIAIASSSVLTNVRNNLVTLNGGIAISDSGTSSTISPNYTGSDPRFIDGAGDDYHLKVGSPARDGGTPIATISTDFDGNARPQQAAPDHGAYEVVFTAALPEPAVVRVVPGTGRVARAGGQNLSVPQPVVVRYVVGSPSIRRAIQPTPSRVTARCPTPIVQIPRSNIQPSPVGIVAVIPAPKALTGRGQRVISAELAAKFRQSYLKLDWLLEVPSLSLKVSFLYNPDGTWTHQYASIGEVEASVAPGGGLAVISDLQVQLYEDNTPYGATALAMRWQTGSTTNTRQVTLSLLVDGETQPYQVFRGTIYRLTHHDGMLDLWATDDSLQKNTKIPSLLVTPEKYPDAAPTALAKAFPLLYGTGAVVGAAPLLHINVPLNIYAVSIHELAAMGSQYAALDVSTRTLQYRTGDVTFSPALSPSQLQFTNVGVQGLPFNMIAGTRAVSRHLGVNSPAFAIDDALSTRATITTAALEVSTANGIGYLGIQGTFPGARGTNTLVVSAMGHRRLLGGNPTTTGQFIIQTINIAGQVVRGDLFRSPEFRHSLAPRDSTFTVTALQLAEGEFLELLILATNEGGIGGALEAYEVGDVAMTILHQPAGDEELYLGTEWRGRVDPDGRLTGTAGTLLTYPSDVTGSLIITELGQDVASSWDMARNFYTAQGWQFMGGLGAGWYREQDDARAILQEIARQSAAILYPDFAGDWRHVPIGSQAEAAASLTAEHILYRGSTATLPTERPSSLEVTLWNLDSVHNSFQVRYGYNPVTKTFNKVASASPEGTSITGQDGLDLLTLCSNSAKRYGTLPPLIIDADMIYDDTTARLLLTHLVTYFWSQRLAVSLDVPLGIAAHLLLGDLCTIDHPSFPPNDRGQLFEVHGIRYLPSEGRIRLQASRILSVIFDYVAIQDQASLVWYYWIGLAGDLTRDTVPPTIPGLNSHAATTGSVPSWWQVVDETQSPWVLYPDTLGQLIIDRTAPPIGTGSGQLGFGLILRGADGARYQLGTRASQEWILEALDA